MDFAPNNSDPTRLTTAALAMAKQEIEKLFDVQIASIRADAVELQKVVAEIPILAQKDRDRLRELLEEKFVGVKTEFTMRDIALAAAFKAAEAAVKQQNESNTLAIDKASIAFTKQIDSLNEKIEDVKVRIAELASKNWATVGAYIVGALGVAALVAAALLRSQA